MWGKFGVLWKLISKNRMYEEIIGIDKKECVLFL